MLNLEFCSDPRNLQLILEKREGRFLIDPDCIQNHSTCKTIHYALMAFSGLRAVAEEGLLSYKELRNTFYPQSNVSPRSAGILRRSSSRTGSPRSENGSPRSPKSRRKLSGTGSPRSASGSPRALANMINSDKATALDWVEKHYKRHLEEKTKLQATLGHLPEINELKGDLDVVEGVVKIAHSSKFKGWDKSHAKGMLALAVKWQEKYYIVSKEGSRCPFHQKTSDNYYLLCSIFQELSDDFQQETTSIMTTAVKVIETIKKMLQKTGKIQRMLWEQDNDLTNLARIIENLTQALQNDAQNDG